MALLDEAQKAEVLSEKPVVMPAFNVGGDKINIVFPESLRKKPVPFVSFSARGKGNSSPIYLPIPPGISFGDGMSYSTLDLGIIGTIGAETITQIANQDSFAGAVGAGLGALAGSVVNKAKKLNAAAAASIIARNIPSIGSGVADNIDFATRQVIAPNTNTTFQNSNIRQFQFSFKLVSKTKKEAIAIDDIVNTFRRGMYPKGNDVVLAYPATWSIRFRNGDGSENQFIPKIYSCYLTALSATFNGSTNLYHEDGSPVETDISVSFQETRALRQDDIEKLELARKK